VPVAPNRNRNGFEKAIPRGPENRPLKRKIVQRRQAAFWESAVFVAPGVEAWEPINTVGLDAAPRGEGSGFSF
jgi:hypothetical protein